MAIEWAALNGHDHIVQWAIDVVGITASPRALRLAAGAGHVACVRIIHERTGMVSAHAAAFAAEAHHLAVLRYMFDQHPSDCPAPGCRDVQRLQQHEIPCFCKREKNVQRSLNFAWPADSCSMLLPARKGHLEILQYLYSIHAPWNPSVSLILACTVPHPSHVEYANLIECYRFLVEHDAPKVSNWQCPYIYPGCRAIQCSACPAQFTPYQIVAPELVHYLPQDLVDLTCEFACDAFTVARNRARLQRLHRIAQSYKSKRRLTSDSNGIAKLRRIQ